MKALGAFGLVFFLLYMYVGESAGDGAAFAALAVYFLACQSLLSRGQVDAHREDWPIMLALDGVMLAVAMMVFLVEKPRVVRG